jgi:hypothetical protein
MKLTKQWLKNKDACIEGYEYYLDKGETDLFKFLKLCVKDNHFDWANWVITKKFNRVQRVKYAVFAAKKVLSIFEEKYPDDKRPRKAIEAAAKCIKNNTKKNRDAASAANAAAYAAAYDAADANAAAYAAYAAYDAAAAYAAYAAYDAAAAYAADANAAYAAYDAARANKDLKKKIINYGIKLLKG